MLCLPYHQIWNSGFQEWGTKIPTNSKKLLAELESLLLSHPAVLDCAVIPIPNEEAGEVPKAFVTLKSNFSETKQLKDEIQQFLASKVAPHKKLRGGIEVVAAIPKTASGKILRRVLKDLEKEGLETAKAKAKAGNKNSKL